MKAWPVYHVTEMSTTCTKPVNPRSSMKSYGTIQQSFLNTNQFVFPSPCGFVWVLECYTKIYTGVVFVWHHNVVTRCVKMWHVCFVWQTSLDLPLRDRHSSRRTPCWSACWWGPQTPHGSFVWSWKPCWNCWCWWSVKMFLSVKCVLADL